MCRIIYIVCSVLDLFGSHYSKDIPYSTQGGIWLLKCIFHVFLCNIKTFKVLQKVSSISIATKKKSLKVGFMVLQSWDHNISSTSCSPEPCPDDDCTNTSCPPGLVRSRCAPCPFSCAHISSGSTCDPATPCFSGRLTLYSTGRV